MTASRLVPLALALALVSPAFAQEKGNDKEKDKGQQFDSVQAIREHYRKLEAENRRNEVRDLAAFATRQKGDEAESAYRQAFNLAILADEYGAAQEAAQSYLKTSKGSSRTRALAALVDLTASLRKGDEDAAADRLRAFLKAPESERFEPGLVLAVGAPLLNDLIRDRKFDQARKLGKLLVDESGSKVVSEHFASRLERLEMLGKPAPAISGAGVDGEKISLDDLKGKVVLVNFWATWCPPCVAETPALRDLQSRYKDKGFRILGVNLDGAREGGDAQQVKDTVKRFVVNHGIDWPNLLEATAKGDIARAYGVSEIPALFLIDRDGKIIDVEQAGDDLDRAVARALGEGTGSEKAGSRSGEKSEKGGS